MLTIDVTAFPVWSFQESYLWYVEKMHAEPKLWESLVWVHGKSVWCFMLNRPMLSPWLQAVLDMGNRNWSGVGCTSGGVDLAVMQWQTHFRNLCAVYSWETPDGFLKAISQLVTQNSKMLSSFKAHCPPFLHLLTPCHWGSKVPHPKGLIPVINTSF